MVMKKGSLLTMNQAAELLKTTRPTLYRWLREGQLHGVKVGRQWRFEKDEVERFLHGRERQVDLPADLTPFLEALQAQIPSTTSRTGEPLQVAFNLMVELAVQRDASSLHLGNCFTEGSPDRECWLRCRVDGDLQVVGRLDPRLLAPLLEHWKRMAACDTKEHALPQDGRIIVSVAVEGEQARMIDLRVSFLPTMLGESMTVRVLDRRRSRQRLDQLELESRDLSLIGEALRQRGRMMIVAGPIGSARDTVLAACLREVCGPDQKVMTVESAAWQFLPWAVQTSVNVKGERRSFAFGLHALLRSEPDVIGVERLPDQESTEVAQDAALQGALVIAGLDAPDSVSALRRLVAMTGSPSALGQTLSLLVFQRLIRKLCTACSQAETIPPPELERLREVARIGGGRLDELPWELRKATGCRACGGSGYRKRAMLSETIRYTPKLARLLASDSSDEALLQAMVEDGTTTLESRAISLAARGMTSLEEATRVFGSALLLSS